jgi:hypothetical protein
VLLLALPALLAHPKPASAQQRPHERLPVSETRYLAFQCFTGAPDPAVPIGGSGTHPLGALPSQRELTAFVQDLVHRVGSVGKGRTRLAVIFGPLAFDHTDAEAARFVETAFIVGLQQNVAVGFHLDDSMFWARRTDLWQNPANVEWLDWGGTPCTGRRIDWGPQPTKLPPQMCFNSPEVKDEVRRRARLVFGKAVAAGLSRLRRMGKADMFAGVIVGWEPQIGQDFTTGRYLGYHAMANRGFSAGHPPRDPDSERVSIVEEFITDWCRGLAEAGIPVDRLYSHIGFISKRICGEPPPAGLTYAQCNHYATSSVAFGPCRRPGFSTYPHPGLFDQIYSELAEHGHPAWASSEGTNLELGSGPGESGMNMETYLAKMFDHGADMVNIFSWGIGGPAARHISFREVTESDEALAAYRKFLRGERLVEGPEVASTHGRILAKIRRIQHELPEWVRKTGSEAKIAPLLKQLDAAMKSNDQPAVERLADEILNMAQLK